jgi:hypothetical protein
VAAYLDVDGFKLLSTMPATDIVELEAAASGWLDKRLEFRSREIDARLGKRYGTPFVAPYPIAVQGWLAAIVTRDAFLRRGVDPTDQQFAEIKAAADQAYADLKEAADGDGGLWELPLRNDTSANGVTRGGPRAYSEQSPYVWTTQQGTTAREEDSAGSGTGG